MRQFAVALAAVALAGIVGGDAAVAQSAPPLAIKFARGTTGASMRGIIRGYGDATYTLNVRKGQMATFNLTSSNPDLYFNIVTPSTVSIAHDETTWHNPLPESGTYRIYVYLAKGAARPGVVAPYTLSVSVR